MRPSIAARSEFIRKFLACLTAQGEQSLVVLFTGFIEERFLAQRSSVHIGHRTHTNKILADE
tara:strand:+ start:6947 stop:7132 length:186 start_codon:yes stop_codon:yes gene_type:complete